MVNQDSTRPGGWSGPALLLAALLSGCGGTGPGGDPATAREAPPAETSSTHAAALHPVERPVARPMDRGTPGEEDTQAVPPVERPVAKPMDRGPAETGQGS